MPGRSASLVQRLYDTERPIRYRPGTCALYRLDSWHRGTPPLTGKHRVGHHITYRRAASEWISWQAYTQPMSAMPVWAYNSSHCPNFWARSFSDIRKSSKFTWLWQGRFLEGLAPVQRGVLGFPLPGNAYWTEDTVGAVGRRYPGMDMSPYREAERVAGGPRL